MRKLVVTNVMSLDGSYDGPGGDVMAMPMDEAFDAHNLERIRKMVVSDTLTEDEPGPWRSTTRMVRRADAHTAVAELERPPAGRSWSSAAAASGTTCWPPAWSNELHLLLGAAVVGGGTPLFGSRPPGRLRPAGTRRFDGSDNVLLRYEVSGR